ncbi:MAG: TonB-dependent receptor [Opitutaceae bacterium]|jgi:TonB-dependent receptor|nr:TonB-dependent receptor [Opitutaceae bacterium]
MKLFKTLCCFSFFIVGGLLFGDTSGGRIIGTVKNQNTGLLLRDAGVDLAGTRQTASTDELGRFAFPGLPMGDYTVAVSYMGLETQQKRITLSPARPDAELDFELTDSIYKLETYVVTGEREGNAAAIVRQRRADNVKNVVSMDAIGYLANENPVNLLVTLPGIAGYDDGEGPSTVSIRGIDPGFSTVTYDGARMATSYGLENRSFRFLNISSAVFEEMEVIKSPTPDMYASAMGGSINMKTKTTLNMRENLLFTYRAGFKINPSIFDYTPRRKDRPFAPLVSLGYKQVLGIGSGRRNFGISLDAFHTTTASNVVRSQVDYGATPNGGDTYIYRIATADGTTITYNDSINLRFDYKYSPTARFFASAMYSKSQEATKPGMETMSSTYSATNNWENFTPDSMDNYSQATRGTMQLSQGYIGFLDDQLSGQIGAEHKFGAWELNYGLSHSRSAVKLDGGRHKNYSGNQFVSQIDYVSAIIDRTQNIDFPSFTQVYTMPDADVYDIDNYTSTSNTTYLRHRQGTRDGKNYEAKVNAKASLALFGHPVQFSSGLAWLQVGLAEKGDTERWNYAGRSLVQFLDNSVVLDPRLGEGMTALPHFNMALISNSWLKTRSDWVFDEYSTLLEQRLGTRSMTENIHAGYLMARTRFGRLTALAGARYERTDYKVEAWTRKKGTASGTTNQERLDDLFGATPEKVGKAYDDIFPGIHLTYAFNKNFIARASWSTSIGRPRPLDMVSWASFSSVTESITLGNPGLKPQHGDNYDFSLEYYLKPVGLVSIGLFRKALKDFIYTEYAGTVDRDSEWWGTSYSEYTLNQKMNGEKGIVDGVEFSYQQRLGFLPKPFDGISLNLNYTVLSMDGDYNSGFNAPSSTKDLIGFIPRTANVRLDYRYRKFGSGISVNYTGRRLLEYSPDWSRLNYRESRYSVGMNMSYRFQRFMEFFLSVSNLTDEPYVNYRGLKSRRERTIYNGPYVELGLSGRF